MKKDVYTHTVFIILFKSIQGGAPLSIGISWYIYHKLKFLEL